MEDNTINFVMGGKLGDFFQLLFAVKNICEKENKKANLYIYDRGWEYGIDTAFGEISEIVLEQSYIKKFEKFEDNKGLLIDNYIDLHDFNSSPYIFRNCWSEISALNFNFKISDYKWISYENKSEIFKNKLLINRRFNPLNFNEDFPYEEIIEKFKDNVVFISNRDEDYQNFPHKMLCDFYKPKTIANYFCAINSCQIFVGNLSAPSSLANSIDAPRIIELPYRPDANHWIGEERYSKNIRWFFSKEINYFPELFHKNTTLS